MAAIAAAVFVMAVTRIDLASLAVGLGAISLLRALGV
jgi:hypothetical protein